MKLFTTSTLLGFTSLFIFLLFSGLDCNNNEEPSPVTPENCGEKVVDRKWHEEFTPEQLKEISTFDSEKRIATFSFSSPGQKDVCPHEHVKVKIQVIGYTGAHFSHYGFNVDILYGILFSHKMNSDNFIISHDANYTYFNAVADFGIKPSAGNDPGWYHPFIDVIITMRNDIDEAIYDFEHAIYMIKIEWEHYKYKEPDS